MNIKEEIGKRILMERKAKGLTRKALAELTDDLKQSRINNWERGERTPGPEEIKQLAKALDVSAAYLMCLTEDKGDKKAAEPFVLVPLLDQQQACQAQKIIDELRNDKSSQDIQYVAVNTSRSSDISAGAFALTVIDQSMLPEFRLDDIQIIDPSIEPKPGDFVAVKLEEKQKIIICKFKKLSYTSSDFELVTLNDNWPNISADESKKVMLIGKVVRSIRHY
ncbi:helix-turn-helix domain-containing protein [Legionella geestiana]|uniref:helix-turn-helix domain-containing protein n=1 Tax=Legionella geestiana TaxID=45065 RepID=UPI001092C44B|nr:XRE family transcriptional regulator [Legionella geestiana]QDQ40246.1 helix-turn-helix domain-containing protein [Legionella geestiana]